MCRLDVGGGATLLTTDLLGITLTLCLRQNFLVTVFSSQSGSVDLDVASTCAVTVFQLLHYEENFLRSCRLRGDCLHLVGD